MHSSAARNITARTPISLRMSLFVCLLAFAVVAHAVPLQEKWEEVPEENLKRAPPNTGKVAPNPYRVNSKKKGSVADLKTHPLEDQLHPKDQTLRLPPLEVNQFNNPAHLARHHAAVRSIGEDNGLNDDEMRKLHSMLEAHMDEYRKAAGAALQYNQNKGQLSQQAREQQEAAIQQRAKALHHKFYRIKMYAIKSGTQDEAFNVLREMMKDDAFADVDRDRFELEIRNYLKVQEDYETLHASRSETLKRQKRSGQIQEDEYQFHRKRIKDHIVKQQQVQKQRFIDIKSRILQHRGGDEEL